MIEQIQNADLISCAGYSLWPSKAIQINNKVLRWKGEVPNKYMDTTHNCIAVWLTSQELLNISEKTISCFDFPNWNLELFIVEAVGSGVRFRLLSEMIEDYNKNGGAVYWHPLKESAGLSRENIVRLAKESVGQPYAAFYQYLLIVLPCLQYLRNLRGASCDLAGKVCSENAAHPYIDVGFKSKKPAHLITPIEVAQWPIFDERVKL